MDFSTLLVLDCKTTLWENTKDQPVGQSVEIICIDVALVNTTKNEVIEHEIIYVKPPKSKISPFCYGAFGISQAKLDADGIPFEQAYRRLRVHYMSRDRLWGSWGRCEKYALDKQCKALELEPLFITNHLDIQHLYSLMTGSKNETNCITLADAATALELKTTINCAYDTAHVYMRMAKGLRPTKTRIVVPAYYECN